MVAPCLSSDYDRAVTYSSHSLFRLVRVPTWASFPGRCASKSGRKGEKPWLHT
ncbi:hypothetical protein Tco_0584864, partial [Tanacetum coccineum]